MKHALSYLVLASALLAGCNNGSKTNPQPVTPPAPQPPVVDNSIAAELRGFWRAPGYGEAVEVTADTVTLYSYTSDFCVVAQTLTDLTNDGISQLVRREGDGLLDFGSYGTAEHHAPGKLYDSATGLPDACNTNLIATLGDADYIADPERDAQFYAQLFDEYYLDFDLHNVDWTAVTQALLSAVSPQTSDEALFDLFDTSLDELNDGHVSLEFGDLETSKETKPSTGTRLIFEYFELNNLQAPFTEAQIAAAETYSEETVFQFFSMLSEYLPEGAELNWEVNENIVWFEMGDIGYIGILGMGIFGTDGTLASEVAETDNVMNTILTEMRDTRGIIVDVRLNGGGFDFVGSAIAGHFTDVAYTGYAKQARSGAGRTPLAEATIEPRGETYTGPVMLLTSSSTASAAETFTIAMRELPHVTIIGEPTHGALSDILSKTLPNGIEVNMSNEFYFSPAGEWFEGIGVPVDVFVPFFTLEQRDTLTDFGIDTAIEMMPN